MTVPVRADPDRRAQPRQTVREHQRLTVANFVELRRLAPDLPIFPVSGVSECDEVGDALVDARVGAGGVGDDVLH